MAPHLTPSKRAVIYELHKLRKSNKALAEKYGCHPTTIKNIIGNLERHHTPYYHNPGRGRKPLFDSRDLHQMAHEIRSGNARDASDVHRNLDIRCHPSTVRKALDSIGLYGRVRQKVLLLKRDAVRKCFAWAQDHLDWTLEDWMVWWYSDESKYHIFGSDGKLYCQRGVGEEFLPRNVTPVVKHGGGRAMVWGVISWNGVGELYHIEGNLNSIQLCHIFETALLHSFDRYQIDPSTAHFQMDNDPKHTSKHARKWLEENHIELMDWPPYSPDMNIIEHVWDILEKALHRQKPLPTSETALFAALEEEWLNIPRITIRHLYRSIPNRVEALYKARGRHTRY